MNLNQLKKIVLKIGTASLLDERQNFRVKRVVALAREIKELQKKNIQVILVTSGAIALGARAEGILEKDKTILEKQALAAIGQGILMKEYEKIFSKFNLTVAQILLTQGDFSRRDSYLSARNTINTLLDYGAVPIINENDSIAVEEIKFGDNDTLSALVAVLVNADMLAIITDAPGLCQLDAKSKKPLQLINEVKEITDETFGLCEKEGPLGTGGMFTKIKAAQIAAASGIFTKIFSSGLIGRKSLLKILADSQTGTLFYPKSDRLEARKSWIFHGLKPKGKIVVDEGAYQFLTKKGKSLLPVGIKEASGNFEAGESVSLLAPDGGEFGRGLVNYSAKEIAEIKGLKTTEVEKKLGYKYSDEVIHRDNLVILSKE